MKLEALRTFAQHLQSEFAPESVQSRVYYFHDSNWNDLDTEVACSESDALALQRARAETVSYHASSSLSAWYYLPEDDCAVQLTFLQSPQHSKRKTFRTRLCRLQVVAKNAYRVAHHPLTHLLARDAFKERLGAAISNLQEEKQIPGDTQDAATSLSVAVLALDIDHFKQINDTWGHIYGDQVLRCIGARLDSCARKLHSVAPEKLEISLGHPSGEEFLILLLARAGKDQMLEWANEFRKSIGDDLLPSESEWNFLAKTDGVGAITPPPLHERSVTVSIGLALHNKGTNQAVQSEPAAGLLDRADTALYRAKAAGRNQAISYDDILSYYGRVIEHDQVTGVVALDIGSNVGVTEGQEFRVYSQTYSGKKKFFVNDGRTRRSLGVYPKVELTRIVAFNVQPELAFAYVANADDKNIPIELGAYIEAIPAGSIGHLLPSSSKFSNINFERNAASEIKAFAKSISTKGETPYAVVVRFSNEVDYLRKYGSVAFNVALAHLYREARSEFPQATYVDVVDRGAICIAGHSTEFGEEEVSAFVSKLATDLSELGVVAGVYCEADASASKGDGKVRPLDPSKAFEFARFSASDVARKKEELVRHFSYGLAYATLHALREARSFEIAYADYLRLRELGLESAALFNLGGLIAGQLEKRQLAMELYAAAILKDGSNLIYKSNFATAAYRVGDIEAGLKVMNELDTDQLQRLHSLHPFGYVTYARLLGKAFLAKSMSFDRTRFEQIASPALEFPEYGSSGDSTIIKMAIEQLRASSNK